MVIAWIGAALAAEADLRSTATALAVGQRVRVTLTVRDGRPAKRPDLLVTDGLVADFSSQGRSFSSDGRSFVETTRFDYDVTAVRSGTWAVGPQLIGLEGGGTVAAPALQFTVSERADVRDGPPLSASARFDRPTAWEGEVVVYRLRLDARTEISDVSWRVADAPGLRPAGNDGATTSVDRIDDPSGPILTFHAAQALVATGTGTVTMAPALAEMTVPTGRIDFFGLRGSRRDRITAAETSLTVRPVPPPPAAWSGLVGDFSLDARLDRTDAAVGDSVAFTVTLTGDGLLDGLSAAPLPDLRGARVYDGETMVRASLGEDGFRSVARVTRSLVPTEPGSLVLPPITWTVFSPEAGDYVVLRAEVPPLRVRGAAEAAEVQSFLGAAEPTPEPVDPIPPPRGERFRLHLSGTWLPAVALFGLLPGLGRGGRALLRWSSRPRAPREVAPATARDLLDAVAGAPDRLAALDAALRAREAQGGDATVADARVALDRARYADGADPEALVRRAILGGA